jgi:hypothetical protein
MKRIIGAIAILISTSLSAISITGDVAQQIYTLMPLSPLKQVFGRTINMKLLGNGYACSQRATSEYHCLLPDPINNKIRLDGKTAKLLFESLAQAKAYESVTTSRNSVTYVRNKAAITCYEQEYVGGPTAYKCVISL